MKYHVLFIQPSLDSVGGIEKVIPTVAKQLVASGHQVSAHVFYGQVPKVQDFWSYQYSEGETVTRGPISKIIKIYRRLVSLQRSINTNKPSHVIVSAQGAIILTLLLKRLGLLSVPVIAYIHEGRSDGGYWYRMMTALIYPWADGWITVSNGIKNEICRLPFIKEDKVVVAYNSIETEFTEGAELAKDFSRLEKPVFITAGRLERTKGADVLVNSFIEYFKTHPGTLIVLGTGSLQTHLKESVAKAQLNDHLQFWGKVENPRSYIRKADAYVSFARSEPFGLALLESLSVGVPVIATDVPYGPREMLSPNTEPSSYPFLTEYGVLIAPPQQNVVDQDELIKSIELLSENPFSSSAMAKRVEDFSPVAQSMVVLGLIKRL